MKSKKHIFVLALMFPMATLWSQEVIALHGRVTSKGRGVPYATLQLQGTSVGVSCNDAGDYEFKIRPGHEHDTVVVHSVGFIKYKTTVARLQGNGNIRLKAQVVELQTVEVTSYSSPRHLLLAAVEYIGRNYHQQTSWSTFFYRDWRAVDGELYLFDEAVMNIRRCSYSQYADKRGYRLSPTHREMESNYKDLLRHRLVVCDRECLGRKIEREDGIGQMLEYADNELFYDPVSTPQASYSLAKRMLKEHVFEPLKEFTADGEDYYLVSSVGPNRRHGAKVRYTYTIRKADLAIVRLASTQISYSRRVPDDLLLNSYFNRMNYDIDSSSWIYDVRDGHYTLTHYYNYTSYILSSNHSGHENERQQWQRCTDWTLTDFSLRTPEVCGDLLEVKLQTLPGAFGSSDYSSDFWGHYNTIPIDSLPLRLLKEKIH